MCEQACVHAGETLEHLVSTDSKWREFWSQKNMESTYPIQSPFPQIKFTLHCPSYGLQPWLQYTSWQVAHHLMKMAYRHTVLIVKSWFDSNWSAPSYGRVCTIFHSIHSQSYVLRWPIPRALHSVWLPIHPHVLHCKRSPWVHRIQKPCCSEYEQPAQPGTDALPTAPRNQNTSTSVNAHSAFTELNLERI